MTSLPEKALLLVFLSLDYGVSRLNKTRKEPLLLLQKAKISTTNHPRLINFCLSLFCQCLRSKGATCYSVYSTFNIIAKHSAISSNSNIINQKMNQSFPANGLKIIKTLKIQRYFYNDNFGSLCIHVP